MAIEVMLTDAELLLLDGKCGESVQKEVDAAKFRATLSTELTDRERVFISAVASEARKHGRLLWRCTYISSCPITGERPGYYTYPRSSRTHRKGDPNYSKPIKIRAVELADRFISFEGCVTLGGKEEAVRKLIPQLKVALKDIPCELPAALQPDDAPRYRRHEKVKCSKCGWEGIEAQMGSRPTLMGNGTYPAVCPDCGAENGLFANVIKRTGEFEVRVVTEKTNSQPKEE